MQVITLTSGRSRMQLADLADHVRFGIQKSPSICKSKLIRVFSPARIRMFLSSGLFLCRSFIKASGQTQQAYHETKTGDRRPRFVLSSRSDPVAVPAFGPQTGTLGFSGDDTWLQALWSGAANLCRLSQLWSRHSV